MKHAPIAQAVRTQLQIDAANVKAAARRKGTTMDSWEREEESDTASTHFELGCWMKYYSTRVYTGTTLDRIDCVRRLFEAGIARPGYRLFTVFDFGERQFDTCFEMGDGGQVAEALMDLADKEPPGVLAGCVREFGWKRRQPALIRP